MKNARDNEDSTDIEECKKVLERGGLVVAPTETSYGLLARVDDAKALKRLFEIKGRDENKPSAVFIHGLAELEELAVLNETASKVARKLMPGPITLVLPSKRDFGPGITHNDTTGFRLSTHPVMKKVMDECEFLITATSANLSGQPTAETIEEIRELFGDGIDLYIDGGRLNNPPSTVVQIVNDDFKILRSGSISESDIHWAINSQ